MLPAEHIAFANRAIGQLEKDSRFLGLAAIGPWATGEVDEFSDINLMLLVEPGRFVSVKQEMASIADSLGPCLAKFKGDPNWEPNQLICLYDDPLLRVALNFVALDDFHQRKENPHLLWERAGTITKAIEESKPHFPQQDLQWMEDRFWVWIHYGAQRLGSGEIFEVHDVLTFLRARFLGPLVSAKAGKPANGVRRVERLGNKEDITKLQSTVSQYNARTSEQALKNAAKLYVELREALAPVDLRRNRRAEMASLRYLHEISERLV